MGDPLLLLHSTSRSRTLDLESAPEPVTGCGERISEMARSIQHATCEALGQYRPKRQAFSWQYRRVIRQPEDASYVVPNIELSTHFDHHAIFRTGGVGGCQF